MNSDLTNTENQASSQDVFQNISIDIDQLPKAEEVEFQLVSPKYKKVQLIVTILIAIGIAVAGGTGALGMDGFMMYGWIGTGALLLVFFALRTWFIHAAYPWKGYALRDKDVIYRTGLIWRKVIVIPFARIQHGELSEGILDRLFGLKKLRIYTAGGSSSDLSIPALPRERAEQLRRFIMERVIEEAEEELEASNKVEE